MCPSWPVLAEKAVSAESKDSAVQLYLQLGMQTDEGPGWEEAMQRLCEQVLKGHVFCGLRTQRRLGYTVDTSCKNDNGSLGLLVSVRSERKPSIVVRAIRECLDEFSEILRQMTEEQFQEHKNSLSADLLEAPYAIDTEEVEDSDNVRNSTFRFQHSHIDIQLTVC